MKPRYVLVPAPALAAVARTLTKAAQERGDYGWRTRLAEPGGDLQCIDKAMRHLEEYRLGRRADPDTGESPIAHTICQLLFLLTRDEESKTEG